MSIIHCMLRRVISYLREFMKMIALLTKFVEC